MKASNYDDYSREDLIRLINERDRKPKFRLLWARHEIDHDRSVNSNFVALDLDPELSCGEDPHKNLIVEGDNFDALHYLRMTHSGLVKCIYIDPPYNTRTRTSFTTTGLLIKTTPNGCDLLKAPTGSGKTLMADLIAETFSQPDHKNGSENHLAGLPPPKLVTELK